MEYLRWVASFLVALLMFLLLEMVMEPLLKSLGWPPNIILSKLVNVYASLLSFWIIWLSLDRIKLKREFMKKFVNEANFTIDERLTRWDSAITGENRYGEALRALTDKISEVDFRGFIFATDFSPPQMWRGPRLTFYLTRMFLAQYSSRITEGVEEEKSITSISFLKNSIEKARYISKTNKLLGKTLYENIDIEFKETSQRKYLLEVVRLLLWEIKDLDSDYARMLIDHHMVANIPIFFLPKTYASKQLKNFTIDFQDYWDFIIVGKCNNNIGSVLEKFEIPNLCSYSEIKAYRMLLTAEEEIITEMEAPDVQKPLNIMQKLLLADKLLLAGDAWWHRRNLGKFYGIK